MAVTVFDHGVNSVALPEGRKGGVTSDGTVWVAIVTDAGGSAEVRLWYSTDEGATWTEDTGAKIAVDAVDEHAAAFYIDASDRPWLLVRDATPEAVVRVGSIASNAITWDDSLTLADASEVYDLVAFDTDGSTWGHALYVQTGGTFRLHEFSWNGSALSDGNLRSFTADEGRLDFNHTGDGKTVQSSSPDLYVAYLSSSELKFVKWTYSSGPSYSVGSTRTIDSTPEASHLPGMFFDGTRVVMVVADLDTDTPLVYERDAADTTTTQRTGPPDTGSAGTDVLIDAVWDANTDDIYLIAEISSDDVGYLQYDRSADSWGSWTSIEAITLDGQKVGWVHLDGASTRPWLGAVFVDSAATDVLFEQAVVLNSSPTAPTVDSPDDGSVQDVNETLTVDWTFNDPDGGDTQSAYTVRRREGSGSYEYWNGTGWQASEDASTKISSSTSELALSSGWGADGDSDHYYAVKTWDSQDQVSPWSDETRVIPSAQDNPTIDSPTSGATVGVEGTVNWTVSSQTKYRVVVSDTSSSTDMDAGTLDYDSGIQVSSTTQADVEYPNTGTRYVRVQTHNDEGLASDIAEVDVTVDHTAPPTPTLSVTADSPSTGAIGVSVTNPAPTGAEPDTDSNDLYRREVGDSDDGIRVATGVAKNGSYTDWAVASGVDYEYRAHAQGDNGVNAYSAWTS